MRRILGAWPRKTAFALLIAAWSGSGLSEVTLDGSLGGARGPLPGPDFEIGADFGRQVGSNLFHSFGAFNLNASESATFSGPNTINNVLGRVTGGSGSNINGLLRSTIPDANLFLLNPAGIVFGPSATLDVQGSFHASTGDFIRLGDGVRFNARPSGQDALLTTAPPKAFGFLGDHRARIEVNDSFLTVPEDKTLSLVGGDISMKNGSVSAPGGQINIISTASPGEVTPTLSGPKLEANVTSAQLGKITLSRNAIHDNEIGDVDASGPVGGAVVIRGGQFVMEGSFVLAEQTDDTSTNDMKGVGVDIRVSSLDMRSVDQDIPALISTATFGAGDSGDVFVETDTLRLSGAGPCDFCDPTGIFAQTVGEGDAGNITVKARQINLETFSFLSAASFAQGEGGDLDVEADNITLDDASFTTLSVPFSASAGNAGNLNIKADDLSIISGGLIGSFTGGPGRGGDISIQADRIFLSGSSLSDPSQRSSITSQQLALDGIGAGNAGDIDVITRHLEVRGANINAGTFGEGRAGDMSVTADNILLVGDPSISFTGLSTETQNDGDAGNLTVSAHTLEIRDNARIDASTLFDQTTGADRFSGKGGNITVTANDTFISGEGAGIVAKSTNNNPAAISGDIHVTATDSIRLENQGTISVETVLADAGDIDIHVNELLLLRNNSSITTSVAGGQGDGGNINIDPVFVILDNSDIIANAFRGRGGNVHIVADHFFASPDSEVKASSALSIDSPDTDVISSALELPESFLDVATLLTQGCAPGADLSRLVVRKYEVLPDSPAALRVPPPGGLLNADVQDAGFALTRATLGPGFEHSSACGGDG